MFQIKNFNMFRVDMRQLGHNRCVQNLYNCDKTISYKIYGNILFQKVALGYVLHFVQNESSKNILKHICLHHTLKKQNIARPGFHLGAPETRKVVTKTILYNISKELLFQRVASGYLSHFVQNESSKN